MTVSMPNIRDLYPRKAMTLDLCSLEGVTVLRHISEEEWQAARSRLVTASVIAAIMGKSSFLGRLQLWYAMQGLVSEQKSTYQDERDMGHDSEEFHAGLYEKYTGRLVADPGDWAIVTNEKYPGLGATLDRLVLDDVRGLGCMEMKWVKEFMRKYWADGVPEHVLYQAQTQMLVTGLPWCSVSVVIGGCKPLYFDIDAHPGVQAGIVRAVAAWFRSLRDNVPPAPTGHETDQWTLDAVFGAQDDGSMECGTDLLAVFEEWEEIAGKRIAIEKREKALSATVKAYMGSHTRAIGSGYEFSISGKNRALKRKKQK